MRRLTKVELLEGVENVESSKIVAYNTVKYKKIGDNKLYIRFHDVDIIIFYRHYIVLNSGGYNTVATKNRINEFQDACEIRLVNFCLYVATSYEIMNFYDGIKISNEGRHIQV